jgi:hypothetical protein
MYIQAKVEQAGEWWAAELPSFCIYTQGTSKEDARRMLASAIKDLLPEMAFDLVWTHEARGELGLKTDNIAEALGFIIRQNRLDTDKTLLDIANAFGAKYPNAVAAYEKGINEASVSKMDAIAQAMGKRFVVSFEDVESETA